MYTAVLRTGMFVLLALSIPSSFLFAQSKAEMDRAAKRFSMASVSMSIGGQHDVYSRMNLDQMLGYAANQSELESFDFSAHQGDFYNRADGSFLGVQFAFNPVQATNGEPRTSREIRVGATAVFAREGMITYTPAESQIHDLEHVTYCIVENEYNLQGEYRYVGQVTRFFDVYAGFGGQLGATMGNEFLVFVDRYEPLPGSPEGGEMVNVSTDTYEANETVYGRAYLPFGLDVNLGTRVSVGLSSRIGFGAQQVLGGDAYFLKRTGSTFLELKYNFR